MERVAFKMKLYAGKAGEYKKRHDELWPGLAALLTASGITGYSIFLDEAANELFAVMTVADRAAADKLPEQEIMQRWWAYMADIMETHAGGRR